MSGISSTNQTGLLENLPELRATMEENLRQFEALSTQAEDLYAKGNLNAAAVYRRTFPLWPLCQRAP